MFLAWALTSIPVVWYIVVGFRGRSAARNRPEYYTAAHSVSAENYATISVGYALQMAAVFLFAYWGILYGLGALWTVLFWFLGYFLLYKLLPRVIRLTGKGSNITLHGLLRVSYGDSRAVQRLAASATIIGLLGTLFTEVDYTSQLFQPVLPAALSSTYLAFAFLAAGSCYIIVNGMMADVTTEQIQVPVAYASLLAVLLALLPGTKIIGNARAANWTVGLLAATIIAILVAKIDWRLLKTRNKQVILPDRQVWIFVLALVALVIEYARFIAPLPSGIAETILDKPVSFQLSAQGLLGVTSLLIANAFWMPVDLSTWQRLESVGGSQSERSDRLRRGTWRVMLESPASWALGVALGWIINATGLIGAKDDAWTGVVAFGHSLYAGQLTNGIHLQSPALYGIFLAGCVAVMLSTVSALTSAISFTAAQDLADDGAESLLTTRVLTLGFLILGFIGYEAIRTRFGANLPTMLYGAYASQLSLFVVVMLMIFRRRRSKRAAIWSISLGIAGSLAAAWLAISIVDPVLAAKYSVLPPVFAVSGAIIGYALSFRKRDALPSARNV